MQFHGTQQNIQILIRIRFGAANSLNTNLMTKHSSPHLTNFYLKYILSELTAQNLRLKYALLS